MFRDIVSRRGLPPDVVVIDGSGNDPPRIPRGRKGIRQDLADFLPNNPRPNRSRECSPLIFEHPSLPTPPIIRANLSTPSAFSDDQSTFGYPQPADRPLVQDVFIVSAVRTPIGSFGGSFKELSSVDLGAVAAMEAIRRAGIVPDDIEETITGSVLTANCGPNVSRQIALKIGVPEFSNAYTVNKVCSSSLKALILATQSQQLGVRKISLVVGTESMSQAPFYLERGEHGYGDIKLVDGIQRDGISDAMLNDPMGLCAEKTARDYHITREDQDAYALDSYHRAAAAWRANQFTDEVVPVVLKNRDGSDNVIKEDEEYKRLIESKVGSLKPAFLKDGTGTITAANASSLNDGAAAAVVVCGAVVSQFRPLAKIVAYAEAGRAPVDFTIAPVNAVQQLLGAAKLSVKDIAKFEVNEAFSVTAIGFMKELGIERNKMNVKGGAVALGHPIGMSGIRIVTTLIHELSPGEYGVAAICNDGEATAILIQRY